MNENWMYYKLQHKENPEVELLCCIDTNTIDNDEPDCEWMWCDGVWRQQVPNDWSVDNQEVTPLLDDLKQISAEEWGFISQALVDWENTIDEVFVKEFDKAMLLISYDDAFDEYYLSLKKSTIQIDGYVKRELDKLKVHERQSYNEVIINLINSNK